METLIANIRKGKTALNKSNFKKHIQFTATDKVKEHLNKVYEKHRANDENQFKNDFGKVNEFEDVLEEVNHYTLRLKIGVMDREIYSRAFLKDVYYVLIDDAKFNLISEGTPFKNDYDVIGVPGVKRLRRVLSDHINVYCFESTKLGGDWVNHNPRESLKHFIKNNELFFNGFFE